MMGGAFKRRGEGLALRRIAYGVTVALTVAVVAVELFHAPVLLIFAITALALVGLAWVLGQATESLGGHAGPRVGGILNATFGNAAELIITIFAASAPGTPPTSLSVEVAIVMFVIYILYLIFVFRSPEGQAGAEHHEPQFGRVASFVVLLAATGAGAYVSVAVVGALEPLTEEGGLSELFVGIIIVPVVGNIAEHIVGVQIAYKNQMDFSMGISLGSS